MTYSVFGSFNTGHNANNCFIKTAVQEDKIEKAISFIFEEMEKLRNGDIEKDAYAKAAFVSPVPGGVGPVTIFCLLENLVKAASL